MWNFRPAIARVKGRLGHKVTLERYAAQTVEVAPGSTLPMRPTVNLPDEYDRVVRLIEANDDGTQERRLAAGGVTAHPPTTSYLLKDALVANGMIFARDAFEFIPDGRPEPLVIREKPVRLSHAQLCTDFSIRLYFGHWLVDGLCLELLAQQRGLIPLPLWRPQWMHEPGYRAMAGLPRSEIRVAQVDNLWIVDDKGCNDARIARFNDIRSRLRRPGDGNKRVFLDRGASGSARALHNREAVVAALRTRGFEEVHPEAETPESLSRKMSDAEICVGVEGSALAHACALMPEGSKLLILEPPQRFALIIKVYADMADMFVGYTVGDMVDGPDSPAFTIPIDRLNGTLDLLESAR